MIMRLQKSTQEVIFFFFVLFPQKLAGSLQARIFLHEILLRSIGMQAAYSCSPPQTAETIFHFTLSLHLILFSKWNNKKPGQEL